PSHASRPTAPRHHPPLHSFPTRRSSDLADRARHDLVVPEAPDRHALVPLGQELGELVEILVLAPARVDLDEREPALAPQLRECLDRKSTRLNSSHSQISYAVFCLKKKKK